MTAIDSWRKSGIWRQVLPKRAADVAFFGNPDYL
jgi:hypothetical protein